MASPLDLPNATAIRHGEWQHMQTAGRVKTYSFSQHGNFLLVGLEEGVVEMWDGTAMPLCVHSQTLPGCADSDVVAVAWSFNNRLVFAATSSLCLFVLDAEDGSVIHQCQSVVLPRPSFTAVIKFEPRRLDFTSALTKIKCHPFDCAQFIMSFADAMPVVCRWKDSVEHSAADLGQLPQLPSLASVWHIPLGAAEGDTANSDTSTAKRAIGDAVWHPVRSSAASTSASAGTHSLLYAVGTRCALGLYDGQAQTLVAPVSNITGTGQRCDLVAHCLDGVPQLFLNTRAGIRVLAPPLPHQQLGAGAAAPQLRDACAALGIQPMVRQDVVYAEPVDGTSLCEPGVAPDGTAVTALPVPGQAGHFTSGLFVFGRGAVGDMQLKASPVAQRGKGGFKMAKWGAGRPVLAALTRGGRLFWCEPHVPCTWPGPMYPAQFNLFPGNRDYAEGEQEWDRVDEQGRTLPLPDSNSAPEAGGANTQLPPVDVVGGAPAADARGAVQHKPSPAAPLSHWSALPVRGSLPPFLGGGRSDSKFKTWAAQVKQQRLHSSQQLAAVQGGAGRKRPRSNPDGALLPAAPGPRGAGRRSRFASVLSRVSVPAVPSKGALGLHALHCVVAQLTGEAAPPALPAAAPAAPDAAADGGAPTGGGKPRIGIEEAVARLVHALDVEQELPQPVQLLSWEQLAAPGEDDGTWEGAHPVVAAEQLRHHASRQLLGMALVFAKSCAARVKHAARRRRAAEEGSSGADARAAADAATGALLKAGVLGQAGTPLDGDEALWEAEEAAFAAAALLAAGEAARGTERYERAVAPADMQDEGERRINKLRSAANGHRLRLLRYSQTHTDMNRAWGIAMQSVPGAGAGEEQGGGHGSAEAAEEALGATV